jgi:hypothetical protein
MVGGIRAEALIQLSCRVSFACTATVSTCVYVGSFGAVYSVLHHEGNVLTDPQAALHQYCAISILRLCYGCPVGIWDGAPVTPLHVDEYRQVTGLSQTALCRDRIDLQCCDFIAEISTVP